MIKFADLSHSRSFRSWMALMMAGVLMLAVVSCNTPPSPTPTASVPGAKTPVPNVTVTVTSAPPVSSTLGGLYIDSGTYEIPAGSYDVAAGYSDSAFEKFGSPDFNGNCSLRMVTSAVFNRWMWPSSGSARQ